jgi:heat shock protein HslJ
MLNSGFGAVGPAGAGALADLLKILLRSARRLLGLACAAVLGSLVISTPMPASAGLPGPVGTEWRMVRLGESFPPVGAQPTLRLDPGEKRAAGFAGCNRYFAAYELSGTALRFGPVGATRKACEGSADAIETAYLDALGRTRSWRIERGELLLFEGSDILARFSAATSPDFPDPAPEILSFHSRAYGLHPVRLTRGEYRAPAAPGAASEIRVRLTGQRTFTTLPGAEIGAVVVATTTGGTGTFFELGLLFHRAGEWVNTDTVLLGDRVKIGWVAFDGDQVVVAMMIHRSRDPKCCPSMEQITRFQIQRERLAPFADDQTTGGSGPQAEPVR